MNSVIKISSDVCYVSGSWRWNAGRSEYARYFNSVLIHHHNRALVLFTYVTSVNGGHQAVFNSQIVRFITTIWHTVLSLAFKCLLDILHNGLCSWVGSRCIWCPHSITVIIYKFVHLSDTGHHTRHQPWPDPESAATRLTTTPCSLHIRASLPDDICLSLATALLQSRLDYSNSVLCGTSTSNLQPFPGQKPILDVVLSPLLAPQIWNHIPTAIKVLPSLDSFKCHLKTLFYLSIIFSPPSDFPAPLI